MYDASGTLVHIDKVTDNAKINYIDKLARVTKVGVSAVTTVYLHHDHLGSAVSGTDSVGNISWTERYTKSRYE